MGQTWNPGTSSLILDLGDGAPPYFLIAGLRSFQNRKEDFIEISSSLWTPENVSNCFGNLRW